MVQNSFLSSKRYNVNEIPSDFCGFGSSFPAFVTFAPDFCNSLLLGLLMLLVQSLYLAQKAAIKWTPVPGGINISLTLTFYPIFAFDCYLHQEWIRSLGRQLLGGMLNATLLRSGLRAFSWSFCFLSVELSFQTARAQSFQSLIFFICVFSCWSTCSCKSRHHSCQEVMVHMVIIES